MSSWGRKANLPMDRKLELLAKAYQDIQQYRDAVPGDAWGTIDSSWTAVWIDCVCTGNSFNPQTVAVLTKLMENLRDPQQRAAALFVRAAAANYRPEAQPDLDEAVRLVPCGFTGAAAYNPAACSGNTAGVLGSIGRLPSGGRTAGCRAAGGQGRGSAGANLR